MAPAVPKRNAVPTASIRTLERIERNIGLRGFILLGRWGTRSK